MVKRGHRRKSEFSKLYSKNSLMMSAIIIVIGVVAFFYLVDFGIPECGDVACYHEYMDSCKKSYVVNEDENYVYRYEILQTNGNSYCDVEVRLLKVKNGGIDAEDLEGLDMVCKINRFEKILPENDMLSCSGKLREELQEIIIDRMHNQILQNLQEIKTGFS